MAKYHSRARDSTAADVAGYSRLMGLDEVGTVRIETFGDVRSSVANRGKADVARTSLLGSY